MTDDREGPCCLPECCHDGPSEDDCDQSDSASSDRSEKKIHG